MGIALDQRGHFDLQGLAFLEDDRAVAPAVSPCSRW